MKKAVTLLLILLAFAPQLKAQQECMELLKTHFEKMSSLDKPVEGQVYYMHLQVKNQVTGSTVPETLDLKAYMSKDFLLYDSEMVQVFKDSINSFAVIHPSRTIVWSENEEADAGQSSTAKEQMLNLKMDFVEECVINVCSDLEQDGKAYKVIDLTVPKTYQKQSMIKHLTFYYRYKTQSVDRIIISYDENNQVRRQELLYKDFDLNYKKFSPKAAHQYVFADFDQLQLNAKYSGYRLIDNRKTQQQ